MYLNAWRKQTNQNKPEKCPDDLLENPMVSLLNKWLPTLVVEAPREDGKRYPAAMINQLLAGLWQAAHSKCVGCPNFMDRKDRHFDKLNSSLQTAKDGWYS